MCFQLKSVEGQTKGMFLLYSARLFSGVVAKIYADKSFSANNTQHIVNLERLKSAESTH